MPTRRALTIASVLILAGGALRYRYYYLDQILLQLLIAFSLAVFLFWVLMNGPKRICETYKDSLLYAVVVVMLFSFAHESAAANKRKNQKYFERLSGIVNAYIERNHTTPESVEEALAMSGETLPHRGDADGNPYVYLSLCDRCYILRTLGKNEMNDSGSQDDVQMNYLNGNWVSIEELSSWIETNGTPDEKEKFAAYFSAFAVQALDE